jgi:tetratricopeptide (TPR) repeat protein
LGNFQDNDVALSFGWGKEWSKGFSIGAALFGTQQKIVDSLYDSLSGQAGLLWKPIPDLRFGLVYTGFGTLVADQALVTDLKGGASTLFHLGPDKSLLLAFSGYYEPNGVSRLQGGMEAGYRKTIFLRAGYQLPLSDNQVTGFDNFTAGAGFHFDSITLDYAYVPYGDLGTSHRISIAYDFPNPTPVAVKPVTVFVMPSPTPTPLMTPVPAKPSVEVQFEVPLGATTPVSDLETSALIEQYEKATETAPQDAGAWHQLGLVYWKAGKRSLAVQCLEQALRLNPSDLKLKEWLDLYHASHPQGQ